MNPTPRTVDDIKALLIESKERVIELWNDIQTSVLTDPQLAALNSTSQSAIWRLWAFVTAVSIWVHEHLWGVFRTEIEAIAARSIAGTPRWYRDMCLKFQYGYPLQFVNYAPSYATLDEAARIVTQAAVVETNYGVVVIKAAKGAAGSLVKLSTAELVAFEAFIGQIKFAGTITQVVSLDADRMRISASVHFNPLYNLSDLQIRVEAAIMGYLQQLPFNGLFYRNALIDAIQAVEGVVDVQLYSVSAAQGSGPASPVFRTYQSVAGYLDVDPAFPLVSTLTYSPNP